MKIGVRLKSGYTMLLVALAGLFLAGASPNAFADLDGEFLQHFTYDNDTHYRGRDAQGATQGLSNERNIIQYDFTKAFDDYGVKLDGKLRATYNGVYQLNSEHFGSNEGGPVEFQTTILGTTSEVPFGGGLSDGSQSQLFKTLGLSQLIPLRLGFNSTNPNASNYNPNQGLQLMGQHWHSTQAGGVEVAVPVRPCNVDARGCVNFGDYGNQTLGDLEAPDFDNRQDWLRELNISKSFPLFDGQELFVKAGRQQIIWGRTDLFRVLDVINPVDYSRNNIYDELQDMRYPMWMVQTEYRMGAALGFLGLGDSNLQIIWNPDRFRPDNLGQCGTPNVILDAGCTFRGFANLWANGGTVAEFAHLTPNSYLATDFSPHEVGIRGANLPAWTMANSQVGVKFEGVTENEIAFSLNALTFRSQLPSLHGARASTDPFPDPTSLTGQNQYTPYLIAFDVDYPRVRLLGGSLDYQWDWARAALRSETAMTWGEEFPNTLKEELYSRNRVIRTVVGFDRPTFIPFINTTRASLISAQVFVQHIFDHEVEQGPLGQVGMPDWGTNFIGTLVVKSWFMQDRVSPQLIQAYDFRAKAYVVSPQVDWLVTNRLRLTAGANVKAFLGSENDLAFDDARSTNPFPPYTGLNYPGDIFTPGSRGLSGMEPLGIFRAGPIGTAYKENEVYVGLRYTIF